MKRFIVFLVFMAFCATVWSQPSTVEDLQKVFNNTIVDLKSLITQNADGILNLSTDDASGLSNFKQTMPNWKKNMYDKLEFLKVDPFIEKIQELEKKNYDLQTELNSINTKITELTAQNTELQAQVNSYTGKLPTEVIFNAQHFRVNDSEADLEFSTDRVGKILVKLYEDRGESPALYDNIEPTSAQPSDFGTIHSIKFTDLKTPTAYRAIVNIIDWNGEPYRVTKNAKPKVYCNSIPLINTIRVDRPYVLDFKSDSTANTITVKITPSQRSQIEVKCYYNEGGPNQTITRIDVPKQGKISDNLIIPPEDYHQKDAPAPFPFEKLKQNTRYFFQVRLRSENGKDSLEQLDRYADTKPGTDNLDFDGAITFDWGLLKNKISWQATTIPKEAAFWASNPGNKDAIKSQANIAPESDVSNQTKAKIEATVDLNFINAYLASRIQNKTDNTVPTYTLEMIDQNNKRKELKFQFIYSKPTDNEMQEIKNLKKTKPIDQRSPKLTDEQIDSITTLFNANKEPGSTKKIKWQDILNTGLKILFSVIKI